MFGRKNKQEMRSWYEVGSHFEDESRSDDGSYSENWSWHVAATRELARDVTAELGQLVLARCCRNVVQLPSKTKEDERD